MLIPPTCLDAIATAATERFEGDRMGRHGVPHWRRVLINGLRLAALCPEVNAVVVAVFAATHDVARRGNGQDRGHGMRGAIWLNEQPLSTLRRVERDLLLLAVAGHDVHRRADDPTIAACWNADRMDYGRGHRAFDPTFWSPLPGINGPEHIGLLAAGDTGGFESTRWWEQLPC